jgi:hypothetical protein
LIHNDMSYQQLGNLVHQYKTEFRIYAPGRCGSTSISNNPVFEPVEHIQQYEPDDTSPELMYIVTREPEARLVSALYQMYRKLYPGPGNWQNKIAQINEYTNHHPVGRIHDWGLPQYIPGTDRVHCQNYIADLKTLSDTWSHSHTVNWVDLSELNRLWEKYQIVCTGRHGVLPERQRDYEQFKTALQDSPGWSVWQSYLKPEQNDWQSVVGSWSYKQSVS